MSELSEEEFQEQLAEFEAGLSLFALFEKKASKNMDGIEQKRQAILGVYPGEKWRKKVRGMSDSQIVAVYMRMVKSGQIKN